MTYCASLFNRARNSFPFDLWISSILYCSIICVGWSRFYFFGYVLHVQDLCELREINTTFWSCFSCIFVLFFVLGGERHKIWAKIPIYPLFKQRWATKNKRNIPQVGKVTLFKPQVGKVISSQITYGFSLITQKINK